MTNESTEQRQHNLKEGSTYRHQRDRSLVRAEKVDHSTGTVRWKHISGSLPGGQKDGEMPIRDFQNAFEEEKAA